jgi:hypothetical protein
VTVSPIIVSCLSFLLFLIFVLCVAASGRGKPVWSSLSAREKRFRLIVLGMAIVGAGIRFYWISHHATSF